MVEDLVVGSEPDKKVPLCLFVVLQLAQLHVILFPNSFAKIHRPLEERDFFNELGLRYRRDEHYCPNTTI